MDVVMDGALRRFSLDGLPVMPWRNGGGDTREIACVPDGATDFDWRLSVATIASTGAFSRFGGVDRVITLLEGAGVRLRLGEDGRVHDLTEPLVPFPFSGDEDVHAELVGPCQDFNVMVRRDRLRAEVRVLRAGAASADDGLWSAAKGGAVLVTTGAWTLTSPEGGAQRLAANEGAWWTGAADLRLAPVASVATILTVRLFARGGA